MSSKQDPYNKQQVWRCCLCTQSHPKPQQLLRTCRYDFRILSLWNYISFVCIRGVRPTASYTILDLLGNQPVAPNVTRAGRRISNNCSVDTGKCTNCSVNMSNALWTWAGVTSALCVHVCVCMETTAVQKVPSLLVQKTLVHTSHNVRRNSGGKV